MGVKLVSSSGGSVELNPPTTASNFTATMPAVTGTVQVLNGTVTATAFPSGLSAQTINYTNSTGKTVYFNAYGSGSAGTTVFSLSVNSTVVSYSSFGTGTNGNFVFCVIPPGVSAALTISGSNFSAGQYVITA